MKIYKFLKSAKNWTKKKYARDKKGVPCIVEDKIAFSYCVLGAAYKLNKCLDAIGPVIIDSIKELYGDKKWCKNIFDRYGDKWSFITHFNDHKKTTHKDVITVLKHANV